MKSIIAMMILAFTYSAFADVPDFHCESVKDNDRLEVRFENGTFTYENGKTIEVAVANKKNNGKKIMVSGLSKGLAFAGGGRQSVTVEIDVETKKGTIRIFTKTFYRQNDKLEELTCTL